MIVCGNRSSGEFGCIDIDEMESRLPCSVHTLGKWGICCLDGIWYSSALFVFIGTIIVRIEGILLLESIVFAQQKSNAIVWAQSGDRECLMRLDKKHYRMEFQEWGPDGYNLWIAAERTNLPLSTFTDDDLETPAENPSQLIVLNFVKSSVINNPHSVSEKILLEFFGNSFFQGSIEHLLLQSEDKVYLYLSGNQQSASNGLSTSVGCDVGWQAIQLPQLYIHNNWPIRVILFLFIT